MTKYKLSICTLAKNESPYLLEWLEFHKLVGVEHFYFYDNESNDNTRDILDFYIKLGEVTYHYWYNSYGRSRDVKRHCINNYYHESEWIGLIDLDEFLFSPQKDNLKEILEEYKEFPAVVVNWLTFGSSGHVTKPNGLQIENFTKRAEDNYPTNRTVKVICQPNKVKACGNIHQAIPVEGTVVTENKIPHSPQGQHKSHTIEHSSEKLRINHYITRSQEEHLNKPRWRPNKGSLRRFQGIDRECNEVKDLTIQRFIPEVKYNIYKIKLMSKKESELATINKKLQSSCFYIQGVKEELKSLSSYSDSSLSKRSFINKFRYTKSTKPYILFIFGCQRSGTTATLNKFKDSPDIRVYREVNKEINDPEGGGSNLFLRLKPLKEVQQKLNRNQEKILILKPIVESQNAVDLLKYFDNSSALWLFRHYRDCVSSMIRKWGKKIGFNSLRAILEEDRDNWRSEKLPNHLVQLVQQYTSLNIQPEDAAALFWYIRNQLFFEQELQNNPSCILLKYEELVRDNDYLYKKLTKINFPKSMKNCTSSEGFHTNSIGIGKDIALKPEIEKLCDSLLDRLIEQEKHQ